MTSLFGVYPFFDYGFTYPRNVFKTCPDRTRGFLKNSLMDVLAREFPDFAFLISTAKMESLFNDPNFYGTLLVPPTIPNVVSYDLYTARMIVKTHLLMGRIRREDILTSPVQQLQTSVKGIMLFTESFPNGNIRFQKQTYLLPGSKECVNGLIHPIQSLIVVVT